MNEVYSRFAGHSERLARRLQDTAPVELAAAKLVAAGGQLPMLAGDERIICCSHLFFRENPSTVNQPIPALVPAHAPSRTVHPAEMEALRSDFDRSTGAHQSAAMWGPVLAAILLDVADVLSFGPQGILVGLVAGSALGWRIAAASGFSAKGRLICAGLAALYCFVPFTEALPLATIVTTASRALNALALVRWMRGA